MAGTIARLFVSLGLISTQMERDLRNAERQIQRFGQGMSDVGQKMSIGLTAPLMAGLALVTTGTKEFRGDLAKLATNADVAGQDMGILNDAMAKLHAVTGEVDSNVEGLSELLATGFRDEQLTTLLDSLYGASIKFADTMKFEGISDGLQETLATGAAIGPFAELLERSGVAIEGFDEGLQKAIKSGKEEQYILDVLAKTGLAETYEAYKKNNAEMIKAEEANYRMQEAMAKMGAVIEPIFTPIIEKVTELANRFNELDEDTQKTILTIAGIAIVVGPLLIALGSVITAGSTLIAVFALLTGPVIAAIAVFAALVAAGVALYQNWDTIKTKAQELWDKIKEVWDTIKTKTEEIWGNIQTFIDTTWDNLITWGTTKWQKFQKMFLGVWEAIKIGLKGYVNNIISMINSVIRALNTIQVEIPDWVPAVGGNKFGINIPEVPMLANGGIVSKPTLAVIGEAGPEAVIPLNGRNSVGGVTIGSLNITGLAETYEAYKKNNAEMIKAEEANYRMQEAMAKMGAVIEPIFTPIIEKVTELANRFNELDEDTQKTILTIAGIAIVVGPLLIALGSVITAGSTLIAVFALLTGPVIAAIAVFAALVAAGVAIYQNWDIIKAKAVEIWGNITSYLTGSLGSIVSASKDAWGRFKADVIEAWDSVASYLNTTWDKILTWATTKWTNFKNMFLGVWDAIKLGLKGYVNNIISMINSVIRALNTIQVEIPDWVPVVGGNKFGIDIPEVPMLAKGGIVTRPTLALIGEAGPEAVIPLNGRNSAGGVTIGSVNITGNNAEEIWDDFKRKLARSGVRLTNA